MVSGGNTALASGGADASDNKLNVIESTTIASSGSFSDFGDLTVARQFATSCSSGHGGLG